jgi:CDP-diglyceride synthetase
MWKISVEEEHRRDRKPKWWRRFWIEATIGSVILYVLLFALYLSNYIDLYGILRGIAAVFFAIFGAYVIAYVKTEVLSKNAQLKLYKLAFVAAGVSISIGITLFGVGVILRILDLPPLPQLLGVWTAIFLTAVIAPIIGGFIGYWLGKRRNFRPPFGKKD